MITTMSAAKATVDAIAALRAGAWTVTATQDYFPALARPAFAGTREACAPAGV
jgi:hypothetical protein